MNKELFFPVGKIKRNACLVFIDLINYAFHLEPILQEKGWFSQPFPLLASWELLQSKKQLFLHKIDLFCRSTAKFIINIPWMYSITADLFSLPNTIRFKRSFRTFPQILCSLFHDLTKSRSKEYTVLLGAFNSLILVAIASFFWTRGQFWKRLPHTVFIY